MDIEVIHNSTLEKAEWDAFVQNSPQGAVYQLSSYLDAIYPHWQALICKQDHEWQAVCPLFPRQKLLFKVNWQPTFCQYTGIIIKPIDPSKPYQHYKAKKEIIQTIADQLPFYHLFNMSFSPNFDYPLPFHWQDFKLFTRYTYQVDLQAHPPIFSGLRENLQRSIKKALKKNYQPRLEDPTTAREFVGLVQQNLEGTLKLKPKQHLPVLEQLIHNLHQSGNGLLKCIRDDNGNLLAGAFFAYFNDTVYYLFGTAEKRAKRDGALSLLIWQALEHAYDEAAKFDFEGSMLPSIEHYFRGFGGCHVPYLMIYKNQLPLHRLWAILGY